MFGPSKALKGDTSDSVKISSENMRQQQWMVLGIGTVCITSVFFGAAAQTWVNLPTPLAIILTIIYSVSYTLLVLWGRGAYFLFHLENDITTPMNTDGEAYKRLNGDENKITGEDSQFPDDPSRLKVKGIIWVRQPLESGGNFLRRFAVLEKGCLDIYDKEQSFISHENPINRQPIKLSQYDMETDPRKFARSVTSIQNSLKSAVLGNGDFTMQDLVSSGYDLPHAAKHFKFALIPKVSSELATSDLVELLGHDERSYKHWIRAFTTIIRSYGGRGNLSVEHTIRSGATEVETVVRAANIA